MCRAHDIRDKLIAEVGYGADWEQKLYEVFRVRSTKVEELGSFEGGQNGHDVVVLQVDLEDHDEFQATVMYSADQKVLDVIPWIALD